MECVYKDKKCTETLNSQNPSAESLENINWLITKENQQFENNFMSFKMFNKETKIHTIECWGITSAYLTTLIWKE